MNGDDFALKSTFKLGDQTLIKIVEKGADFFRIETEDGRVLHRAVFKKINLHPPASYDPKLRPDQEANDLTSTGRYAPTVAAVLAALGGLGFGIPYFLDPKSSVDLEKPNEIEPVEIIKAAPETPATLPIALLGDRTAFKQLAKYLKKLHEIAFKTRVDINGQKYDFRSMRFLEEQNKRIGFTKLRAAINNSPEYTAAIKAITSLYCKKLPEGRAIQSLDLSFSLSGSSEARVKLDDGETIRLPLNTETDRLKEPRILHETLFRTQGIAKLKEQLRTYFKGRTYQVDGENLFVGRFYDFKGNVSERDLRKKFERSILEDPVLQPTRDLFKEIFNIPKDWTVDFSYETEGFAVGRVLNGNKINFVLAPPDRKFLYQMDLDLSLDKLADLSILNDYDRSHKGNLFKDEDAHKLILSYPNGSPLLFTRRDGDWTLARLAFRKVNGKLHVYRSPGNSKEDAILKQSLQLKQLDDLQVYLGQDKYYVSFSIKDPMGYNLHVRKSSEEFGDYVVTTLGKGLEPLRKINVIRFERAGSSKHDYLAPRK